MLTLETERLILRNYQQKDLDDLVEYFSKEEVAQYEDFYPMTREEVQEMLTDWAKKDHRLVAVRKEDNKVIGSVGYWIDEDDDYSIDYDFNPIYGKMGYATEAAKELVRYLFQEVKIPNIYGDCDIRNENSWKLMERLGFSRIGHNDNDSYKEDEEGNPIIISTYYYELKNVQ